MAHAFDPCTRSLRERDFSQVLGQPGSKGSCLRKITINNQPGRRRELKEAQESQGVEEKWPLYRNLGCHGPWASQRYQDRRRPWPNSRSWMLVRNMYQVLCDSLHAGHVFQCCHCNYWMSWRVISNLFNAPWKILVSNICHDQLIFVPPQYFLSQTVICG